MGKEFAKNYQKQALLYKEWLEMWKEFEQEFAELPYWAQKIMIRDMNTAFKNRMLVIKTVKSLPSYSNFEDFNKLQADKTQLPQETLAIKSNIRG